VHRESVDAVCILLLHVMLQHVARRQRHCSINPERLALPNSPGRGKLIDGVRRNE
jgi:hypothetical protein